MSFLSHNRLPTPTGTGQKERLQGHHQSCQFTSTAVEMLPQTWVYRFPVQRTGNRSLPASYHLKGSLWSYQNETAQKQLQSGWNRLFFGLHTPACPKICLSAPSPVLLLDFWCWITFLTQGPRRRPPQQYTRLPPLPLLGLCLHCRRCSRSWLLASWH